MVEARHWVCLKHQTFSQLLYSYFFLFLIMKSTKEKLCYIFEVENKDIHLLGSC